ncbi:nucleotide exchange factor GrpE [Urinicoccus timonensis]|uniref:nucleotide exchange factor GrpE n=1 Tax=Urinicoccus timonensis TaxID=2024205 RepID=UPI000C08D1DE|nr:nucleotide exchange factor GrpE [Urinicoccus timonensis]
MAKEKKNEDLDLQEEDLLEEDLDQEDCSEENPEVQAQEDSYKDQLIRLTADFTNYKRRVEKEKKDFLALGVKKVALDLLGVIDNFERALDHSDEDSSFKEGVEMIYQQLLDLLKKNNICPMEALNEKFDPNRHHAVLVEEKEGVEEGVVIDVVQKGYMINDEVLRPAMVKVSQ